MPELNSNEPQTVKNIDFTDRNAVERFLETDKFRPCANLKCPSVSLQHGVLYMPECLEGRFDREGVARNFEMPIPSRPLSSLTYTTIGIWAPLVSCPPDCKGYRNRNVAKLQRAGSSAVRWLFGRNRVNDSSIVQVKRWWERPFGIIVIGILVTVIGGLILWRIISHYDKPTPSTSVEQPKAQPQPQAAQPEAPPLSSSSSSRPTPVKPIHHSAHASSPKAQTPSIGSINQGAGSALSINQKGGITAGTINIGPPPPPPLKLTWTVHDVIPPKLSSITNKSFNYEKSITVTINTLWSPVAVAVGCDTQVAEISAQPFRGGALMNSRNGYSGEGSKIGWAYFENATITPSNPLLVDVWSDQPCAVLDVRTAIIKGVND